MPLVSEEGSGLLLRECGGVEGAGEEDSAAPVVVPSLNVELAPKAVGVRSTASSGDVDVLLNEN